MDIKWHGSSCVSIKGKTGTVVIDPYDRKASGLKLPKFNADIVLANADNKMHDTTTKFGEDCKVFNWPGEYESKNIIIQGIPAYDRPREKEEGKKDSASRVIVFTLQIDGFKICHLSNIGHKLTPEILEAIGDTDILLIPVGGQNSLDAKKAHEVIEQIDPRIVIPMNYDSPAEFLKEMGIHSSAKENTAKFQSKAQLPQGHTDFVILEPTG